MRANALKRIEITNPNSRANFLDELANGVDDRGRGENATIGIKRDMLLSTFGRVSRPLRIDVSGLRVMEHRESYPDANGNGREGDRKWAGIDRHRSLLIKGQPESPGPDTYVGV